jgi:TRAP transporter TAXI family solute receptor
MRRVLALKSAVLASVVVATACGGSNASPPRVKRLSIATGGTGGVYYPYGGAIAKIITENLPGVEATAEVTAASVDNLKFLRDGRSDIALTLADTLAEGVKGTGPFSATGPIPAQALAVLYTNYTHIVALEGSGIRGVTDLKGRVVSVGAAGGGTEMIAFRILEAAGMTPADVRRQSLSVAASVDALKDGKLDAFFWSGGVPTAAILDLANTPGKRMVLIPSVDLLASLQNRFGGELYFRAAIPQPTYPGLQAAIDVVGVVNLLVVNSAMQEDLAYQITSLLFSRQAQLAAIHPEASHLSLQSAVARSPAAFHPGAIRFYREKGVWTETETSGRAR